MHIAQAGLSVDLLPLHAHDPERYPFLLQSASHHARTGRYDILFAFPDASLVQQNRVLSARGAAAQALVAAPDLFAALDRIAPVGPAEAANLPFCGGWFLYFGYEAAAIVEPRLRLPPAPPGLPDALAVHCAGAIVVDRERSLSFICAETDPGLLALLQRDLAALASPSMTAQTPAPDEDSGEPPVLEEDPPERFLAGVTRILEYIRAGDVFQVNLSRSWRARWPTAPDPARLYAQLRARNPAPFAGSMRWGGCAVLSSSPERLLALRGERIETRPIAGTCARYADPETDARARRQLLASVKERAEHVMLIDLERNDLGRVCVPGSVVVDELMAIESYARVHHIVSAVSATRRARTGPGSVLRALFPGGTITGCPKIRAMEIIAELEGAGRGAYTGAFGYLSADGGMDLNILIRTLVVQGCGAELRAGAGIVADSRPDPELQETRHKARALLAAIGVDP